MTPAIVFDVGGVLVNFSHEPFRQFLLDNNVAVRSYDEFLRVTKLLEYESGKISCHDFLSSVEKLLANAIRPEQIASKWNDIFSAADEMLDLLSRLKQNHRVYLFSNTNDLHWKHLNQHFLLEKSAHGSVVSFRVGAMKPDQRIYRYLMETFELAPEEIIFLDDREDNIQTARDLGWKTIRHISFTESKQELLRLGAKLQIRSDTIQ